MTRRIVRSVTPLPRVPLLHAPWFDTQVVLSHGVTWCHMVSHGVTFATDKLFVSGSPSSPGGMQLQQPCFSVRLPSRSIPPHEGPFPRNAAVAQKTAVHHGAVGAAARPGSFCACVAEEDDERLDL